MEIVIAILAGICPVWWPPIPRWWYHETGSFFPPVPKGDEPRPNEGLARGPSPEPWLLIVGVLAGLGGAIAWTVLGDEFRAEGGLLPPVVFGFLGGAAAAWLANGVRNLTGSRRR